MARRSSAVLCLVLMLVLLVGLNRWTQGFEVWTFEGRRQRQLLAGELHAPPVALRGIDRSAPRLWGNGGAAPAAYLVDFVYTSCPSVCRALGGEYQQMQRELLAHWNEARLRGVHLVSISFDVAREDPERLARYAADMHADARHWTLGVPATHRDAQELLDSLGVVVVPDGLGGFAHNGAIHLLDERGSLRGLYDFDQWPQALEAARQRVAKRPEALR